MKSCPAEKQGEEILYASRFLHDFRGQQTSAIAAAINNPKTVGMHHPKREDESQEEARIAALKSRSKRLELKPVLDHIGLGWMQLVNAPGEKADRT